MGQTITVTTLLKEVAEKLPELSTSMVIAAGAGNLPALATSPTMLSVLRSIWNTAISRTMMLSVALVAVSLPFTVGMEWLNAKVVSEERKRAAGTELEVENDPNNN
jgi:hypothetical protein